MSQNAKSRDIDALRDLLPDCPDCEERLRKIAERRAARLTSLPSETK